MELGTIPVSLLKIRALEKLFKSGDESSDIDKKEILTKTGILVKTST
jgi:hypothetical protein